MASYKGLIVLLTITIAASGFGSNVLPAAWMESGDNTTLPGPLVYHAIVEDSRGNLWLFGGVDPLNPMVAYNDIYKMEVRSSYTWQHIEPVNPNSAPSTRGDFMMWIDQQDNIYIYGGVSNYYRTDYYSDLLRFNTSSYEWTTLRGQSTRVLGAINSGTGTTHPGSRAGAATWFDEANKKLMLYGGESTSGILAEVWEYSLTSGIWTWVSGQNSVNVEPSADVIKDTSSTTAFPGSVWGAATAKDRNGVVWFYGGHSLDVNNQLWNYNIASKEWTFIGGNLSIAINSSVEANFGTTGQYSSEVYPPPALSANLVYSGDDLLTLTVGSFAYSMDANVTIVHQVWSYNISDGLWAFIFGQQDTTLVEPYYRNFQQSDVDNLPGSRFLFAKSITRGNSWIVRGWDDNTNAPVDTFVYPVNKCSTDLNPCIANADCADMVGFAECTCQAGYIGDGFTECLVPTPSTPPVSIPVAPPRAPVAAPPISPPRAPTPTSQPIAPVSPPTSSPAVTNPPTDNGEVPSSPGNGTVLPPPADSNEILPPEMIPAIVIPVVIVIVGIILLVVLLKRKKNKVKKYGGKNDKKQPLEPVDTAYFSIMPSKPKDNDTNSSTMASPLYTGVDQLEASEISTTAKTIASSVDDRMNIPYSELKFVREIGAGAYGKVYIGEWQKTTVALKISSASSTDEFIREAALLINLRPHPNVVQILGVSASTDGVNVAMIMEYCDGGSLDKAIANKNVTFEMKIHYLSGIAKGMYHLHKNKIVHRDLAARNILLSRGNEAKISDFGMSRKITDPTGHGTTKSTVGPIRWMSPESLRTLEYSTKSDVWSFGILCWEVLSGQEPHINADPLAIGVSIRDKGVTPKISDDWHDEIKDLLKDCWKLNPAERPEFEDICNRIGELTYNNNTIAKSKFK